MKINSGTRTFLLALLLVALGSLFTWRVHGPSIGIDDANITQAYAQHLAQGLGYVYNAGGERVEGSTSLLWTVINTGFFLVSGAPEFGLTILCLLLTALCLAEALSLASLLGERAGIPGPVTVVGFSAAMLCQPAFFTWSVWTLMDLTLWTWLFTVIVSSSVLLFAAPAGTRHAEAQLSSPLWLSLLAMPLVRPEGIAVSVAVLTLLAGFAWHQQRPPLLKLALWTLLATVATLALVTAARVQYFGYPVPNTFYAKVSMSVAKQAIEGAYYVIKFVKRANNAGLLAGGLLGAMASAVVLRTPWRQALWVAAGGALPVLLILSVYIAVGGDHFGSFRQLQVVIPVLAAFTALLLGVIYKLLRDRLAALPLPGMVATGLLPLVAILACLAFIAPPLQLYAKDKGKLDIEFRLAEDGRQLGDMLNRWPFQPSIGVIAAGGIARTFQGPVYDLVGLNWSVMAHAPKSLNPNRPKNHAAFNQQVLYSHPPEVLLPEPGPCDQALYDSQEFRNSVLDNIFQDARFQAMYAYACRDGLSFYVRRDKLGAWGASLHVPAAPSGTASAPQP
jgi:arabinofuranosyltransferase